MREIRIESWNELQERLYEGSWQESLGRFRSTWAYRGVSSAEHSCQTSLARLGEAAVELEGHMLRNFRKYARKYTQRDSLASDSIWSWLAVAQHHGLPTRLLDWTYSPFVALHFVTETLEQFDRDGVILCVNYVRTNESLPEPLQAILQAEGSDVFTAEMLEQAATTLPELDALSAEGFVLFYEPPSLDDRIVNQFALFSLLSNARLDLETWLERHPDATRRLVIPASLKWEVRDKLDQANITERVLYPGLDGLSRWLRRYYYPREKS